MQRAVSLAARWLRRVKMWESKSQLCVLGWLGLISLMLRSDLLPAGDKGQAPGKGFDAPSSLLQVGPPWEPVTSDPGQAAGPRGARCGAMEAKHRRILRRLRLELAGQLRVEMVVQYLYQERVVSQGFLEEIQAEPVSARRTLKLLDHLPSRGARAFAAFAESLREEFPWLRRRLEEEERAEEEEPAPPADELRSTISDHVLNSVPTDKQLNQLSSQLGPEWERAVVDLGLRESDIYRCKMNHQYNVQAQILAAFVLWKHRLGKRATVRSLCDSLISAEADSTVIGNIFREQH